jgi:hypothetical protein
MARTLVSWGLCLARDNHNASSAGTCLCEYGDLCRGHRDVPFQRRPAVPETVTGTARLPYRSTSSEDEAPRLV